MKTSKLFTIDIKNALWLEEHISNQSAFIDNLLKAERERVAIPPKTEEELELIKNKEESQRAYDEWFAAKTHEEDLQQDTINEEMQRKYRKLLDEGVDRDEAFKEVYGKDGKIQ